MTTINAVIQAVINLMQAATTYTVRRGPLGTEPGIAVEPEPSAPSSTFFTKNTVYSLGLVLNGKDKNMEAITEAMNRLHSVLTRATSYPSATNWQILNIITQTSPSLIERQPDDFWLFGSALTVEFFFRGEEA